MIDKLNGETTTIPLRIPFKCPSCNGFGTVSRDRTTCHGCGGKGWVVVDQMTDSMSDKLTDYKHDYK